MNENYKGLLLECIQKQGISPSSVVFTPTQCDNGMFECNVQVPAFLNHHACSYSSDKHTTKKSAEREAAKRALDGITTNNSSITTSNSSITTSNSIITSNDIITSNSSITTNNGIITSALACANCKTILLLYNQIMLYFKTSDEISLCIKPEVLLMIHNDGKLAMHNLDFINQETDAFSNGYYCCLRCKSKVGTSSKMELVATSSTTKTTVNTCFFKASNVSHAISSTLSTTASSFVSNINRPFPFKKWKSIHERSSELEGIDKRDNSQVLDAWMTALKIPMDTTINTEFSSKLSSGKRIDFVFDKSFYGSIESAFGICKVDYGRKPRREQMDIFGFSLKHNLIAVLPTGCGKTLPAVVLMDQMIKLNPSKIAVMIVDRRPLVDQQASVYDTLTGGYALRLIGMYHYHYHHLMPSSNQYLYRYC